ncbi:2-oxoglutarate-dependent dioxygenase 21, chloroplastic [Ziziphus jujuba]|uniref:2-oxoglutarate-dependent dioxygenase 21, chloroplastic n=1 Tax=Ziziphus jujuba TaxID=326968 RepID=A0A6P4B0B3_ZIZJJ|nr:2-oxoglutarate-dependent dioxygenase 21, chloroplastic [Ziziphus jujuba]
MKTLHPSEVPTIDFNDLSSHNSETSSLIVAKTIHQACQEMGFFQIINHGISKRAIEDAFDTLGKFFALPSEENKQFLSDDVHKPVRFVNDSQNSRDFLKLYAHPIEDWIDSWPNNPADFRDKVGNYAKEVRKLGIDIIRAIMESLGLAPNYLRDKLEKGMQMIVVNSYEQCSPSTNIIGASPHTDHSIITILLENTFGLEVLDLKDNEWKIVPAAMEDALIVLVGDHLELLSNGLYKSVFHRVVRSSRNSRISIGSFQSLAMRNMVEPAVELVDKDYNPKRYGASSLEEYIKYLASHEAKPYVESLKI